MTVYFDTSAFIALFADKEQYHGEAKTQYQEYKRQRALLLTSNLVLAELYTRLSYDFGSKAVSRVAAELKNIIALEQLRILWSDEVVFGQALEVLIKFSEHKISFVDAVSYTHCKELKVDEVFTLDSDFRKMGLTVAP